MTMTKGNLPKMRQVFTPDHVYKSSTGALGEIGNGQLVGELVGLYAKIEGINETAALIEQGVYPGEQPIREYVKQLSTCLQASILVEYILKREIPEEMLAPLPGDLLLDQKGKKYWETATKAYDEADSSSS
ncbi:hypothetical protein DAT35_44890 [Vitiosangium sp. GDMCC 1.1324]|nr:hypothetical protein DAT35_44890 [Vitiosangium sp. GDMCC 1.1324]